MPSVTLTGQVLTISQGAVRNTYSFGIMLPPLVVNFSFSRGFDITLPMLQVHANFTYDPPFVFNVILPKLSVLAYFGMKAEFTLPMPTVQMGMSIPNVLRVDALLPDLQVVWSGDVGHVWRFAITLPEIYTSGRIGGLRFPVLLPALEGGLAGGGIISFNSQTSLSFDITLPRLQTSATMTAPTAGYRFFVVLPALMMSHGLAGRVLLPALRASARFSVPLLAGQAVQYRGWAMNLQNNAVTEFAGFDFRAMGFAYNQHYGVGMDGGLYRMGGDKDVDRPIAWAWESGLGDLGMNAQKGLLALYVDGLFENTATFSIQTDNARRIYGHRAKGDVANHLTHRVPLGRGVRTRNFAIGMADEAGGYLELDKITPEYVITSMNL